MSQLHLEEPAGADSPRVKDQLLGALERELVKGVSTLPTHFSETFTDTGAPARFVEVGAPEITGETTFSEIMDPSRVGSRG